MEKVRVTIGADEGILARLVMQETEDELQFRFDTPVQGHIRYIAIKRIPEPCEHVPDYSMTDAQDQRPRCRLCKIALLSSHDEKDDV